MQASHPDPYPSYRQLLAGPALWFDPAAGLWVASRAAVVREVMDHPDCHVRPASAPVPPAIAGTSAGALFGALMRMNEGDAHLCPRRIAQPALATVDPALVAHSTRRFAK